MGRWQDERRRDPWRRQAKASGYRARSAFKLKQIQRRFELIRPGDVVLDVGCHPGGWTQVAVELTEGEGQVIGVDLDASQPVDGADLIVGDITDPATQARIQAMLDGSRINSVISDIAPDITGNWTTDQAVAMTLVAQVVDFSLPLLKHGGNLVTKVFEGVGMSAMIEVLRPHFIKIRRFAPTASRNASSEVYLVARHHRPVPASMGSVLERWEALLAFDLDPSIDEAPTRTSTFTVRRRSSEQRDS